MDFSNFHIHNLHFRGDNGHEWPHFKCNACGQGATLGTLHTFDSSEILDNLGEKINPFKNNGINCQAQLVQDLKKRFLYRDHEGSMILIVLGDC